MSRLPLTSTALPITSEPLAKMRAGDLLVRIFPRWHINPVRVILIVAAYGVVHALALPALFGHLHTSNGITGTLDDGPNLVTILLLAPLVVGYYAWQPAIIQALHDGIGRRTSNKPAAAVRASQLLDPLGWPVWSIIGLAVGGLECAIWITYSISTAMPTWQNVNWVMIVSLLPMRFIVFYSLVAMLVRQVVVLVGLNRFFKEFLVEIQPLHPDRAGGLRVLGDYVITNGLIVAVVGLILGMQILRVQAASSVATAEFYIELIIYFLAAPTVFFLFPLYNAHARMIEAKQKLLAEIAEQFDLEYRVLLEGLRQNVLKLEEVQRLEAIQKIYEITRSSPDWPFDLALISKFGAAIVLPLLAPLGVELMAKTLIK